MEDKLSDDQIASLADWLWDSSASLAEAIETVFPKDKNRYDYDEIRERMDSVATTIQRWTDNSIGWDAVEYGELRPIHVSHWTPLPELPGDILRRYESSTRFARNSGF